MATSLKLELDDETSVIPKDQTLTIYNGIWKSNIYTEIYGKITLTLKIIKLHKYVITGHDVIGLITLHYNSIFRHGQTKTIKIKGKQFEMSGTQSLVGSECYRYILHSDEVKCEQYFIFTFLENKELKLQGFYSCIFPNDIGQIELLKNN